MRFVPSVFTSQVRSAASTLAGFAYSPLLRKKKKPRHWNCSSPLSHQHNFPIIPILSVPLSPQFPSFHPSQPSLIRQLNRMLIWCWLQDYLSGMTPSYPPTLREASILTSTSTSLTSSPLLCRSHLEKRRILKHCINHSGIINTSHLAPSPTNQQIITLHQ